MNPRQRVFFALWPAPALQRELRDWGEALQSELGGRTTLCESIHLTLAFIGEADALQLTTIQEIAAHVREHAFAFELDRVGCWKDSGIGWAGSGATPPEMVSLASALHSELMRKKLHSERRDFAAHVTLLRDARCARLRWQVPAPLRWEVDRFCLMRSVPGRSGSVYSEVASWPLSSD
jgi:RNA 2',3'-cyclic 3'-phosphodiesterase